MKVGCLDTGNISKLDRNTDRLEIEIFEIVIVDMIIPVTNLH